MIKTIFAIIFLCFLISFCSSCSGKKALTIDPFFTELVDEVMCFDSISGKVSWRCPKHEVKNKKFDPTSSYVVGWGYFDHPKVTGSFVFFTKYNSSNKSLSGQKATLIETVQNCECYKKVKGEALNIIDQIIIKQRSYMKRAFKSPFKIVCLIIF